MKSVVHAWGLMLLVVWVSSRGRAEANKSEECCDDDENGNATRRALRVAADPGPISVSRWNNPPSGKRKKDAQCACTTSNGGSSIVDRAVTVIVCVFVVVFLCVMLARSYRGHQQSHRRRKATEDELENFKSQVEMRIRDAKSLLTDMKSRESNRVVASADDACPVCLEAFVNSDSAVHPPNCKHLFHYECLCQWLDTAAAEAAKKAANSEVDASAVRALACPTCCRPLYAAMGGDVEANVGDDEDDDAHREKGCVSHLEPGRSASLPSSR